MLPVLTITLNPALDISTSVPEVVAGPKLRCAAPRVDPGGGGINVSRAIRILGGQSRALVAMGGAMGQRLAECLAREGIALEAFSGPGETRQSLAVTENSSGKQYRFVLPGAAWTENRTAKVIEKIWEISPIGGFAVLSGSQPPGVSDDFAGRVAERLEGGRVRLVVDTSGAPLRRLCDGPVPGLDTLRMDSDEAEGLAGRPLPTRQDTAEFAAGLVARGVARCVIVARGEDGSVLVNGAKRLFSKAAAVPVNSKVGAGDSFVAGYVLALAQGDPVERALARGVAAAAAAVMTEATELCRRADAERLLDDCAVSAI